MWSLKRTKNNKLRHNEVVEYITGDVSLSYSLMGVEGRIFVVVECVDGDELFI